MFYHMRSIISIIIDKEQLQNTQRDIWKGKMVFPRQHSAITKPKKKLSPIKIKPCCKSKIATTAKCNFTITITNLSSVDKIHKHRSLWFYSFCSHFLCVSDELQTTEQTSEATFCDDDCDASCHHAQWS